ncbi:hypothetical protein [Bacillus paramobilis]|uniref:hypothetical protein n=1 Tax=Bacillus paramobilis TaxID=2817477 RepID=UPI001BB3EBC5|nr:hypothetical protein [Bacillus paramobilis]
MEGQTRRDCATGVLKLLVSGGHDTVTRLFSYLLRGYAGCVANYSKENGVGRGHAPYDVKSISYTLKV